jgi:hypothetical protein
MWSFAVGRTMATKVFSSNPLFRMKIAKEEIFGPVIQCLKFFDCSASRVATFGTGVATGRASSSGTGIQRSSTWGTS